MRSGVPTAAKRPSITRIDTLATSRLRRAFSAGGRRMTCSKTRLLARQGRGTSQRLKASAGRGCHRATPGVRVRFVSPQQLQPLLKRLRRVALLVVVGGLTGQVALGHAGLPWAGSLGHQVVLILGPGWSPRRFFAWLLAVFGLGFRWGTVAFWALLLVQLAR